MEWRDEGIVLGTRKHGETAAIAEAPVMSPSLRDKVSNPPTTPRRSAGTSPITAVLLAAWKSW